MDEVRKKNALPLFRHKIKDMKLEEIKEQIPRLYYEGLLMSMDILANEHLRSKDPKKKRGAAAQFLNTLAEPSFLKNIQLITSEAEKPKPAKDKKPTADWGKA